MKRILLILLIAFGSIQVNAQCAEGEENKIMLIGDSWAFFMFTDGTFDNVLDHWGMTQKRYFTNATLSVSGARTEDFLEEARMNEIENQLNSQPSLEVVHISLGGNDFLGNWNVDFTEDETNALSDETFDEMTTLIDFIREVRPGIQIVFSGYMYANFEEVINDAAPFEESHPFYGNWEEMGFPTFEELNTLLNGFSDRMEDYADVEEGIDFINVPALMQRIYGQEEPLGVDPGGTYAPYFQPLPYGDLTYPSPKVSMRDYGITRDCFHLSAEGFFYMIDYQFQKFYHKFLMDDAYLLAEEASKNGSVNAGGDVSGLIALGGAEGTENQTVISFNTSSLPDTVLTGASIYLRVDSIEGTSPLGETVGLTMINGALGTDANLNPDDFDAAGEITSTACVFGQDGESSDWVRIDLPEEMFELIGNDGDLQFLIRSPESGSVIYFSGTDDPEFAPVFNLRLKTEFVGIDDNENFVSSKTVFLYPNPAKDQLNFYGLEDLSSYTYTVYDLQGRSFLAGTFTNGQSVNIDAISNGQYIMVLNNNVETIQLKFVKE